MAKSKKQNYQSFQSAKGGRLAAVYFDMMESKAWEELSGNDIKLYLYMLKKYSAKYFKGILVESNKDNISLPKKEYLGQDETQKWIIKIGRSTFTSSIDHLIELGFVKVVEYKPKGGDTKLIIYGFNDMWQYYGTNKFAIKDEWRRTNKREEGNW
jgi:hypothetical protein